MLIPEGRYGDLRTEQEIIRFGGLNKTNDYVDGELEDCDRVTGRGYPYLETDDLAQTKEEGIATLWGIVHYGGTVFMVRGDQGTIVLNGHETQIAWPDDSKDQYLYHDPNTMMEAPVNLVMVGDWVFYNYSYAINLAELRARAMLGDYHRSVSIVGQDCHVVITINNRESQSGYFDNSAADFVTAAVPQGQKDTIFEWTQSIQIDGFGTDFGRYFVPGQIVTLSGTNLPEQVRKVKEASKGKITFTEELEIDNDAEWTSETTNPDYWLPTLPWMQVWELNISFDRIPFSVYLERNNRLWGASNLENTIYASALGDFFNFSQYEGISTDGYAVAVTAAGEFTGGCALSDGVIFFKKDRIYKITGDYPEEYTMYEHVCAGVRPGAERSVVVIENVAYYLGEFGVYAYSGGDSPVLLSRKLGPLGPLPADATDIVAGRAGRSYCLYATVGDEYVLYTYSLDRQDWTRRTLPYRVTVMDADGEYLNAYMTSWRKGEGKTGQDSYILRIGESSFLSDLEPWWAEFKPFRDDPTRKKRPERLHLRLALRWDSWAKVLLERDESGWKEIKMIPAVMAMTQQGDSTESEEDAARYEQRLREEDARFSYGYGERVVDIPINPGRCDVYRLRLEGEGRCRILALTRETRIGGTR